MVFRLDLFDKRPRHAIPSPVGGLPPELWAACVDFLRVADIAAVAAVSHTLHEAADCPEFWSRACDARFDNLSIVSPGYDARDMMRLVTESRSRPPRYDPTSGVPGPRGSAEWQLLQCVTGWSSCDREEEAAHNTLAQSVCGRVLERVRTRNRGDAGSAATAAALLGGGARCCSGSGHCSISTSAVSASASSDLFGGVSSGVDSANAAADAVLASSDSDALGKCPLLLNLAAQDACGCYVNPCYWSSAGSPDPDSSEWISYSVPPGLTIVTEFCVTPYQVFWHPGCPAYAPRAVQLVFRHPDVHGGWPYWASNVFPIEKEMREQRFVLPRPTLCFGGEAVVRFLGKVQRQTLGPRDDYYISVSNVSVAGVDLHRVFCLEPAFSTGGTRYVRPAAAAADDAAVRERRGDPPVVGRIARKAMVTVFPVAPRTLAAFPAALQAAVPANPPAALQGAAVAAAMATAMAVAGCPVPPPLPVKSYIVSDNMELSNVLCDYEAAAGRRVALFGANGRPLPTNAMFRGGAFCGLPCGAARIVLAVPV